MKSDWHATSKAIPKSYPVDTIALYELLVQYDALKIVDCLSVDTGGSKILILSHLDFPTWKFRVINVEHIFTDQRNLIQDLFATNVYVPVCEGASRVDDWYLNREFVETGRFLNA
jgi:hypothetical protein